jgi:hypothetical protein
LRKIASSANPKYILTVAQPTLLDGVADEIGPALEAEIFHRPGRVRFDHLDSQFERAAISF